MSSLSLQIRSREGRGPRMEWVRREMEEEVLGGVEMLWGGRG